jgi:hypothetical protein
MSGRTAVMALWRLNSLQQHWRDQHDHANTNHASSWENASGRSTFYSIRVPSLDSQNRRNLYFLEETFQIRSRYELQVFREHKHSFEQLVLKKYQYSPSRRSWPR